MASDRLREPKNTHTHKHTCRYTCVCESEREWESAFKTRKRLEAPPQRSHRCCLCRCLLTMFGGGVTGSGRGYRLRRVHIQIKSCRVAKTSDPPHRQTDRLRDEEKETVRQTARTEKLTQNVSAAEGHYVDAVGADADAAAAAAAVASLELFALLLLPLPCCFVFLLLLDFGCGIV